ncbi:SDR family NAD(P)-dependent oxidoreductase [Neoroseomonas marina]|uniref:SDR family NAD(P)-dependent oxidoreductase n=1 Tax=Neoroseomonas marina TaxID=1232220 RepID=UPI001B7D62CB|nr:SDR family NAD(P)-dependent oxidoreductase [Neoroseomonas marina]
MSRAAVLTGGGSGIGEGIARRLAGDGVSVRVAAVEAEAPHAWRRRSLQRATFLDRMAAKRHGAPETVAFVCGAERA